MSIKIERIALATMIQNYDLDHFFSVKFIKRTTGEQRDMVCRKGVRAYVKGAAGKGLQYDPFEKGLVSVWDAQVPEGKASAYRSIPLDGLLAAKIDGVEYEVIHG